MNQFNLIKSVLRLKDLQRRILLVLGLVVFARVFAAIPLPSVDQSQVANFFQQNEAFGLLNIFTGGGLENFSLALLGVGPYITSSIIFQLLTVIIPKLEELSKEGEAGRQKINQWTRILTIPLGLIQGWGTLILLKQQNIIVDLTLTNLVLMLIISTTTTLILMWLGELISEQGIGNGVSLLITVGILSAIPSQLRATVLSFIPGSTQYIIGLLTFVIIAILTLVVIIYMSEGVRNIPISYTRHIRGGGFGGIGNYLPIKVNAAGVIPIIFAISLILFPPVIAQFFQQAESDWLVKAATFVKDSFENQTIYGILYFILVFIFTYFYTFIIFKPDSIAENLQKQGGFIPGIRPGKETEMYVHKVINHLTLISALFLGLVAVLPLVVESLTQVSTLKLGGTSILIIVSVTLETLRQIRAQVLSRTYEVS